MSRLRTIAGLLLSASALLVPPPTPAFAWGATGHEFVSGLAAEAFPDELPAFLRTPAAVADIAVLGRELDRSKGAGNPHDAERNPGHYVHLDDDGIVEGALSLGALPITREAYDTALRGQGQHPIQDRISALLDRRRVAAAGEGLRLLARRVGRREDRRARRRSRLVRRRPPAPRDPDRPRPRRLEPLRRRRQPAAPCLDPFQ